MQQWKIFKVTDRNNQEKQVPQKRLDRIYTIERVELGLPGIFSCEGGALKTSFVQSKHFYDEFLIVTTENSIYHFQTCDEEGNWC